MQTTDWQRLAAIFLDTDTEQQKAYVASLFPFDV